MESVPSGAVRSPETALSVELKRTNQFKVLRNTNAATIPSVPLAKEAPNHSVDETHTQENYVQAKVIKGSIHEGGLRAPQWQAYEEARSTKVNDVRLRHRSDIERLRPELSTEFGLLFFFLENDGHDLTPSRR